MEKEREREVVIGLCVFFLSISIRKRLWTFRENSGCSMLLTPPVFSVCVCAHSVMFFDASWSSSPSSLLHRRRETETEFISLLAGRPATPSIKDRREKEREKKSFYSYPPREINFLTNVRHKFLFLGRPECCGWWRRGAWNVGSIAFRYGVGVCARAYGVVHCVGWNVVDY